MISHLADGLEEIEKSNPSDDFTKVLSPEMRYVFKIITVSATWIQVSCLCNCTSLTHSLNLIRTHCFFELVSIQRR
jgi:hypothetical protein